MTAPWICLVLLTYISIPLVHGDRHDVMNKLVEMVDKEQIKESTSGTGLFNLPQTEGMYNNNQRLNAHGNHVMTLIRQAMKVPSTHSFISPWVGVILLDAFRFGEAPKSSEDQIERIVKMYTDFHDKNADYDTSLITFRPQVYKEEYDEWIQFPPDFGSFISLVQDLGIEDDIVTILYGDKLAPEFRNIYTLEDAKTRDIIPLDADCAAINLALGATLRDLEDEYPVAWDMWKNDNTNITSVFDFAKKYAYRPFSTNPDECTTDSRTYYTLRDFYDQAKNEGRELAVLHTWGTLISELQARYKKGLGLSWGANTVDVSVIVNVMSALVSAITSDILDPEVINNDPDLQLLLESSGDAAVHQMRNDFSGRPDLALVFYPSMMEFYYFSSRALMFFENDRQNGSFPVPVLENYYHKLADVMRGHVTQRIIGMRDVDKDGSVHFDDFLGNADMTSYDEPIKRYEDRIFTTSMAANALLQTWTFHDKVKGLQWLDTTPDDVKETIYGCAKWLEENTLTGEFSPSSIFFSRADHSFETLQFWYPATKYEYLNGTKVENFSQIPENNMFVFGVDRYIEPDEYEEMLKVPQFGIPTPDRFTSVNNEQGMLVFWSSEALTYSSVLLTLAMVEKLNDN